MEYPQLTQTQFQVLVLIFAAHADYDYSEAERSIIKKYGSAQEYEDMMHLFDINTDYQILKIILSHKLTLCNNEADKNALYNKIVEVFLADGEYSRPEKVFLKFLDRMIKTEQWN